MCLNITLYVIQANINSYKFNHMHCYYIYRGCSITRLPKTSNYMMLNLIYSILNIQCPCVAVIFFLEYHMPSTQPNFDRNLSSQVYEENMQWHHAIGVSCIPIWHTTTVKSFQLSSYIKISHISWVGEVTMRRKIEATTKLGKIVMGYF